MQTVRLSNPMLELKENKNMTVNCSSFDFSKDMWRFMYCHTKSQIKELYEYLRLMDEFISKSEQEELSALEKEYNNLPSQVRDGLWQENYPVHWEDIFASNLRSSLVHHKVETFAF